MKENAATHSDLAGDEAAGWFVRVDAGADAADEAALARWLAERPQNERALERVELAAVLARRLAADPSSALYGEALFATRPTRRRRVLVRSLGWGALAGGLLAAFLLLSDALPPNDRASGTLASARRVSVAAPVNPVAVLPTGAVVDASTVAVLPFASSGDAELAAGLERDVAAALREVPGLYVIAGRAVQPYAATELSAADIGGMLGARGLVEADIELSNGRIRVDARLRETATNATLWQVQLDRPVDELRAVREQMADAIASAMFDSSLRAPSPGADGLDAGVAVSKPFQQ